ncbi:hypothetical protein B0H14DRAFT_2874705 [Mycena olivaceomarginata]|nr:hypothetical protein B0H14DRAFT_2874705 [Mycena olivaceomarginata]
MEAVAATRFSRLTLLLAAQYERSLAVLSSYSFTCASPLALPHPRLHPRQRPNRPAHPPPRPPQSHRTHVRLAHHLHILRLDLHIRGAPGLRPRC